MALTWISLSVALLAAVLLPAPPAAAAPAGSAPPVDVTISSLEPRTVTPDSTVVVGMTLTNDSDDTITDLSVRLQRGERLTSRDDLAADVAEPSAGEVAQAPFQPVTNTVLEPGDDAFFQFSTPAADLALTEDGVYPVLVNVNGTRGGLVERVGELSTYLPVFSAATSSRTSVAWLWPLTDRPHRDASGAFTDDELADSVAPDGRLDRALDVLEELPDGGRTVPVTLAVDPALVEVLQEMARGYTVDGATGRGTADAVSWLDRLRALAAVHPVVALPYADVDADALMSAGLPGVVTRALPGAPGSTDDGSTDGSGDGSGDGQAAGAPDGSGEVGAATGSAGPTASTGATDGSAGQSGSAGESDAGGAGSSGAQIIVDALGTTPRTDLVWPAGGVLRADTLATLTGAGVDQLVLAEDAYAEPGAAVGRTGRAAAARVTVDASGEQLTTLVADRVLGAVVAGADTAAGGARVAEQRYLAELGVLTYQLAAVDPAVAQTVLVVPPREVQADASWATPMLADTVGEPWLAPASLTDLADGPSADAGPLVAPTAPPALGAAGLADVAAAVAVRDDVAAAVGEDADDALARYDAAIARSSSAAWRDDPDGFAAAAADVARTLQGLRGQVGLVPPADGTYSLASSDAPLVLTVRNDLPFPVTVVLELRARAGVGFAAGPVAPQRVEPESRTVVTVPTTVRQSGGFTVVARVTTPAGGQLGQEVELRVSSTAYGPVTLAITVGAAALLGLLFLRRLVLFVLRRRRGEVAPADDDPAAVEGGTGAGRPRSGPPTRSPV
ncbi:DUF6049 family protein [Klenkia sp. LSe6-5]|uniref:DUF6049 family protein n=1 Tax=Klenkia sesuvii TaxID=3103137 RepID=A0ABU8DS01_9ACTN